MEKKIDPKEITAALNKSLAGIESGNKILRGGAYSEMTWINPSKTDASTNTNDIQKRGHTYPGDSNNLWGMNGLGMGFDLAAAPYYGRFPGFHDGGIGFGGYSRSFSPANGGGNGSNIKISNQTRASHRKMAMAVEAYKGFGIIKNVIDLMCNFASEGISIQHPRPAVKQFYERWAEQIDLEGRVKDMLRYYYKYGNVFVYTTYGKIDNKAYTEMKAARANSLEVNKSDIYEMNEVQSSGTGEKLIPWRYTLLNPFQMDLRGTKFFGENQWVFVLDEDTINQIKKTEVDITKEQTIVSDYAEFADETEINLPPEFKKLVDGKIVKLDQSKLWCMHYMKDDHEDWADPMIWPVIGDVHYKQKLRAMDISVCDSAINAITIFKIGDLKNDFVAPEEHYNKLAEMLRTPSAAMNMVWNDAISMESNYPPVEKILGIQKYESVDRDILAGLGISEVIVNGRGGNYSSSFLSVRTLLERLEEGRREVMKWVTYQLRMIAKIMGHRDIPAVKFGQMSLRDEQAEKQLVVGLLDRNVISIESAHEILGFDFKVEKERLKSEDSIREADEILVKHGPFIDPMNDMPEDERQDRQDERLDKQAEQTMEIEHEKLKQKTAAPSGRPGGVKTPHAVKRNTKPKGMANFSHLNASKRYNEIEAILVEKVGGYKKSLTKERRAGLDNLVFMTLSTISLDVPATKESVEAILAKASPNTDVMALAQELTNAFAEIHKRAPDAYELKVIKIDARATVDE